MSAIEVGDVSSDEINEQAHQRQASKAVLAKQRKTARAKAPGENVHGVDRGHGPSLKQQATRAQSHEPVEERNWQRAYSLPAFPNPPGFVLCWIARHRRRHGDDANLSASLREGWVFVRPDELDEVDIPTETFTGRLAKHGEVVGDETTVLMKMSVRMKAQRDAYYNRKRDAATKAVTKRNPGLAEANPKMPLVEDRNEVSTDTPRMRARRMDGQPRESAE